MEPGRGRSLRAGSHHQWQVYTSVTALSGVGDSARARALLKFALAVASNSASGPGRAGGLAGRQLERQALLTCRRTPGPALSADSAFRSDGDPAGAGRNLNPT